MAEESNIENKFEQHFKELMLQSETDAELKKEVFNTISKIKNLAEVIDLFTVKFIESEATFFNHIFNPDNK